MFEDLKVTESTRIISTSFWISRSKWYDHNQREDRKNMEVNHFMKCRHNLHNTKNFAVSENFVDLNTFIKNNSKIKKQAEMLWDAVASNDSSFDLWIVSKAPAKSAEIAVRQNRRYCPEAEKILLEKASNKGSSILKYCSHFGIVLKDMTKITLKASFGEKSHWEKRYIKELQQKKKHVIEHLIQLMNAGEVDPKISIENFVGT